MKETLERLNTVFDTITDLQPLLREVIKQGYRIIIARKLPDEEYHKHSEVLQKMTDICNLKKKALSENNYEYLALLRDRERAVEEWMVFNYAKTTKLYFKIENWENKELIFYPPDYWARDIIGEMIREINTQRKP